MNKEEKEFFYSIGRGSLNLNGKFYYGLDYSITDFMNSLEQENKQLKAKLEMYENGVYYSSENDKLKEVIEEVREYINSKVISNGEIIDQLRKIEVKELLQILDKAKN